MLLFLVFKQSFGSITYIQRLFIPLMPSLDMYLHIAFSWGSMGAERTEPLFSAIINHFLQLNIHYLKEFFNTNCRSDFTAVTAVELPWKLEKITITSRIQ
jgi:hypothetical protein